MQRNLRQRQQNSILREQQEQRAQQSNQRAQYGNQVWQQQQGNQDEQHGQELNFLCISATFYIIMLFIVITAIISIVAATKNEGEKSTICILLIFLLIFLFGCVLYLMVYYSEGYDRYLKIPQEKSRNKFIYEDTIAFFFQYSCQSQFTVLKLTYMYIIIAILILAINLVGSSQIECPQSNKDNYGQTNHNCKQIQGFMLKQLGIMCISIFVAFFLYEGLYIFYTLWIIIEYQICPSYQYNTIDIKIPTVIYRSKVYCIILLINSFFKFIALLVIIILTPNDTSYILLISNIIYHVSMILVVLTLLELISKVDIEKNNINLFINHQKLIDSLLMIKNVKFTFLKFLLIISFILIIVGLTQFEMQENIYQGIINYDTFILYDCAIAQLIIVCLILFKYLIFLDQVQVYFRPQNQAQVMQDQEILNNQPQQVQIPDEQPQLRIDAIPIVNINRNKPKLQKISNINNNFIYQVELKEKADCVICLEQLISNSDTNPIIQLKCHFNHIFHKKCIIQWLNQIKKCPICNTEFK